MKTITITEEVKNGITFRNEYAYLEILDGQINTCSCGDMMSGFDVGENESIIDILETALTFLKNRK